MALPPTNDPVHRKLVKGLAALQPAGASQRTPFTGHYEQALQAMRRTQLKFTKERNSLRQKLNTPAAQLERRPGPVLLLRQFERKSRSEPTFAVKKKIEVTRDDSPLAQILRSCDTLKSNIELMKEAKPPTNPSEAYEAYCKKESKLNVESSISEDYFARQRYLEREENSFLMQAKQATLIRRTTEDTCIYVSKLGKRRIWTYPTAKVLNYGEHLRL